MASDCIAQLGRGNASDPTCFHCGGHLTFEKPVGLVYWLQQSSKLDVVELPGSSPEALDRLASACTPIPCMFIGDGDAERSALELAPAAFSTNFMLESYGIIPEVQRLLAPNNASVTAELCKLNIYAPGACFKPREQTLPQGVIGTLVVCLPCAHQGGGLIVGDIAGAAEYLWQEASATHVQWVAFHKSRTHGMPPCTSGRCVTLTYYLYAREATAAAVHVNYSSLPAYRELQALLRDPAALPYGGTLGFGCAHAYAHTTTRDFGPADLKGVDAAVHAAAVALGLQVSIQPVWRVGEQLMIGGDLRLDYTIWDMRLDVPYPEQTLLQKVHKGAVCFDDGVTWCTMPSHEELALIAPSFPGGGNNSYGTGVAGLSSMIALLVEIPPAEMRQQQQQQAAAGSRKRAREYDDDK